MKKQKREISSLLLIDRPGIGLSDFQHNRTIVDWSSDISELSEELNLKKFGVLSFSAGAPYALACGLKIPEKLNKIVIVSALGGVDFKQPGLINYHKAIFRIAGSLPLIYRFLFWWCRVRHIRGKNAAQKYYQLNLKILSTKDQEVLQNSDILDAIVEYQCEAYRKGCKGLTLEAKLLGKPWGMNLNAISSDVRIYLWHGIEDLIAPVTASKEIERMLPKSIANYKEDEGNISLFVNHYDEILEELQKSN